MAYSISFNRSVLAVSLTVMVLAMTSCHSSRGITGSHGHSTTVAGVASDAKAPKDTRPSTPVVVDGPLAQLLREADSWKGTPYRYGGNDRNGVDCSGFVLQVYKTALGISLPRSSREQQQYCSAVSRDGLEPGDLVFFATSADSTRVSHVGIYLGNDKMIHSSSSKGVIETNITSNYYTTHYHSAGRIDRFYAMAHEGKTKAPKAPKAPKAAKPSVPAQPKPKAPEVSQEVLANTPAAPVITPTAVATDLSQLPAKAAPQAAKPKGHHGVSAKAGSGQSSQAPDIQSIRERVLSGLSDEPLK